MNMDDLNNFSNLLKEKLGEEQSAIVSGDLGELMTRRQTEIDEFNKLTEDLQTAKDTNEKLSHANAQLLQQIPVAYVPPTKEPIEEKEFSWYDQFDDKGRFITK